MHARQYIVAHRAQLERKIRKYKEEYAKRRAEFALEIMQLQVG